MKQMTPQRYEQIRSLFVEVCELEPLDRSAILDAKCLDDPDLRSEVESLLREEADHQSMLRDSRIGLLVDVVHDAATDDEPSIPKSIGRYRLLKKLGEGGMGTVFEAEQDNPRRTVAVKIVRPGIVSDVLLRRFSHEAHVLGLLKHPGIAQIHDAGAAETDFGTQPYFVMEIVRGRPLLEYARHRNLSTRERLELVASIADAVHHAHTKGVVHRDLKPSNILIDESADPPQPKILDFGVARATDSDIRTTTLHTDVGQLIGTVPYMSPEQASGDTAQIDTRSDVYALGVVCYELLTGRLPYDLDRAKIHEAARIIREDEPVRLSSIDRLFRGDIETIVAKALEKDKERRYQSAADLAADIRRYLHDEPIFARPASAMYQLRKFAKRNKALVGGVLGVMLALLLGTIGTGYGFFQRTVERDKAVKAQDLAQRRLNDVELAQQRAESEANKAIAVSKFLQEMLGSADPSVSQGNELTVVEMLNRAASQIDVDDSVRTSPETRGMVHQVIGMTFRSLGHYDQAESHLLKAVQEMQLAHGAEHKDTLDAAHELCLLYMAQRRFDEAETCLNAAWETAKRVHGPDQPATWNIVHTLINLYINRNQFALARPLLEQLIQYSESHLGPDDPDTVSARMAMAHLLNQQGQFHEARLIMQEVYRARLASLGEDHPRTLTALNNLASALQDDEELAEADRLYEELIARATRVFGPDHPDTIGYMANHAVLLTEMGRHVDAEKLYRRVLEVQQRDLGADNPDTATTENGLAVCLMQQSRFQEAEQLLMHVVEVYRDRLGENNRATFRALANLAASRSEQGRYAESVTTLQTLVAMIERSLGPQHPTLLPALNNLAIAMAHTDQQEQALQTYQRGLDIASGSVGRKNLDALNLMTNLADLLRKMHRCEDAEAIYAELIESSKTVMGADHIIIAKRTSDYGACLTCLGKYEDAERTLLDCFSKIRLKYGDAGRATQLSARRLAELYEAWNKPDKAAEYRAMLPDAEKSAAKP